VQIESRGYRINYLAFGDAPEAIVLLHGNMQAAEDWQSVGYPELLTRTHRVIAIDLLGYGYSDKPHDVAPHHLDGRVSDVVAVLDAEGIERAAFWGYSMGVVTAEAFAKRHPERVTALICGGNLVNASPDDRRNLFSTGADHLEQVGLEAFLDAMFPDISPELQARRDLFGSRNDGLAVAAAMRGVCMPSAAEEAPLPDKTLNYMGADEQWFELVKAVAEQKGIAFTDVPGDHGAAFRDAASATSKVLAFLEA
jgi:pimeloyl-ACP methyl ester carboxylesterase